MKCPRCSAELFNSSTFCPQCGFNHQQNLNTPENYTPTSQERPATFSYLPAGTPPWPTTVPQNVPGVVAASATQSQRAAQAKADEESKPRNTVRGVLSVIAVLILAPIIGIMITFATVARPAPVTHAVSPTTSSSSSQQTTDATPVATPATTSQGNQDQALPTPTAFKTAKDTNVNISLQYPADWTAGDPKQSATAAFFNIVSQGQIGINFSVIHLNDSTSGTISNADQLNQLNIQQLSQVQSVSNIQNVQVTNNQPSIGGTKWIEKDATFLDGSSNTKIHFATISVQHGKSYYIIYFSMPDNIYSEAMKKYIEPMLNSVKFLS
jgi:hypothetical protein